mmetsp:Transcript_40613/g.122671  ORF Transcript_40613/g.122671 Transcript_40613/m.122671 type:complete len:225 (+) Transcript_40613:1564-2238(+)
MDELDPALLHVGKDALVHHGREQRSAAAGDRADHAFGRQDGLALDVEDRDVLLREDVDLALQQAEVRVHAEISSDGAPTTSARHDVDRDLRGLQQLLLLALADDRLQPLRLRAALLHDVLEPPLLAHDQELQPQDALAEKLENRFLARQTEVSHGFRQVALELLVHAAGQHQDGRAVGTQHALARALPDSTHPTRASADDGCGRASRQGPHARPFQDLRGLPHV